MLSLPRLQVLRTFALASSLTALAAFGAVAISSGSQQAAAKDCPPGMSSVSPRELFAEFGGAVLEAETAQEQRGATYCVSDMRPESFAEIAGMRNELTSRTLAPFSTVDGDAYLSALQERERMIRNTPRVGAAAASWKPYGTGPLISNDPRFEMVNGLGLVELNGRVDSLDYDPTSGRLFALVGTGGVWLSEDMGARWRSIGDSLPSQINGALAWTPARGGTLVVVSGEHLMGGNTYTGVGAFWSNDLGKTWHQAKGVPTGALGFQVAVDRTAPDKVYVATSKGLFQSTDAGREFQNVSLPTGECEGRTDDQECLFANYVTDVVVREPGGVGTDAQRAGTVLAAVGYRVGARPFPQEPSRVESPCNGLFRSDTGNPGTFQNLGPTGCGSSPSGFAPFSRIGRTEMGIAEGAAQDHDYVYAIVQDAELMRGGVRGLDHPESVQPVPNGSYLNGIYVSSDFGTTWTRMADGPQIANNPLTGSSLAGLQAINGPGIQAWYNEWIKPDPTRQTAAGIPTRLTFGLEEVWQNRVTTQAQNGASDFKVIGRYFADENCQVLIDGTPVCPNSDQPIAETTTHPDQHEGLYVPDGQGGVTLVVGNDGGVYTQKANAGQEFDNTRWGVGSNQGFHTLLPYHAQMAKDGTVWMGLQDNGTGRIEGDTQQQFMAAGGDGLFVGVDPNNSDIAYGETPNGLMRVTKDGGRTWRPMYPPISAPKFVHPFVMDPTDANHLMTAGNEVVESTYGPDTHQMDPSDSECISNCWEPVYDLGTRDSPGANSTGPPNSMSAIDLYGDNAYVGFCAPCDIISSNVVFESGLATNVGGTEPPKRMTSDGWHIAKAAGLPDRYITSIAIDPRNARTVYVALGGYANRQWRPPGSFGDLNPNIGTGHVYVSHDAGQSFTDISGNLPDAPAFWVEFTEGRLIVGTQVGAFGTSDLKTRRVAGTQWTPLDQGMPVVPISTIETAPHDPNLLVAATFGRGVYTLQLPPGPIRGLKGCGRLSKLKDINKLYGTTGKDVLKGTAQADAICGGPGKDVIKGLNGNDVLIGGKGNDRVRGASGNDRLYLGAGNDRSSGGKGKDRIVGFKGDDRLGGGGKRDTLNGQSGTDSCNGGAGRDRLRRCERGSRS